MPPVTFLPEGHGADAHSVCGLVVNRHIDDFTGKGARGQAVHPCHQGCRSDHDISLAGDTGADARTIIGGEILDDFTCIFELLAHEDPIVGNKAVLEKADRPG